MKHSAFRHGLLRLVGSILFVASTAQNAIASGGLVYALNQVDGGPNQVYGFRVTPTGVLTPLSGFPVATGGNGGPGTFSELVAYKNGRLFVVNEGSASLSVFAVDSSGALTPAPYGPITIGGDPSCVAVHPSGSPVIVGWADNVAGNPVGRLSSFTITSTMAVAAAGGPAGTSGAQPFSCAFSRDGNYAYTGGNFDNVTAAFNVNPITGVLTQLAGSPFTLGTSNPVGYATDNFGRLFVSNVSCSGFPPVCLDGAISVFTTSAGSPTAVTGNPFPSGLAAGVQGVLHPSGNFYIIADRVNNKIGVYRVAGSDVATTVTAVTGSPFAGGGSFTDAVAVSGDGGVVVAANGQSRNLAVFSMNAETGVLTTISVQAANSLGMTGLVTGLAFVPATPGTGDFDGDGKVDLTIFRPNTGTWFVLQSSTNYTNYSSTAWGASTDIPVPGDYDGDGKTDLAVYRPSTGVWWVLLSSANFTASFSTPWGNETDTPVPGDYDGDGKTDLAVYRPSTGTWFILQSTTNRTTFVTVPWGTSTDIPVPGDYDGDGKTDLAVYRPSTGSWFILRSNSNYTTYFTLAWGASADIPVPGDYDGDGKTDLAVYRPSTGTWFVLRSTTNYTNFIMVPWGVATDIPVVGDYDGDGKTDITVYRPASGTWFVLQSTSNYSGFVTTSWGAGADVPLPRNPR